MDPSGVQAARQTSLAEKKRRMKASSQQQQITPTKVHYLNLLHHSFLLAFVTHHVSSSHLQGWTQSSKMKPLPVKAIEGPDTVRIVLISSTLFCGACTSVNFAMLFSDPRTSFYSSKRTEKCSQVRYSEWEDQSYFSG